MEKIIAPKGSKVDLSVLIDSIQNVASNNTKDFMDSIFKTFGVLYSGVTDTNMEISQYSTDSIEVSPGIAIVPAGHPIVVSSNDPVQDRRLTITDGYSGSAWISYIPFTTDPVQILDGFAWLASGTQFEDSMQFPYYGLTVNDPGNSGIELATVHRDGSNVYITDLRGENKLEFYDQLSHFQNTDWYTTNIDFKVGVGHEDYGNGLGLSVKLVPETPLDPIRIRIKDISPVSLWDDVEVSAQNYIPFYLRKSYRVPQAKVEFEWGFDYVTGTGGSSEFTMEGYDSTVHTDTIQFSVDELIGYYFRVDSVDYLIVSNDVTDGSNYTRLDLTLPNGAGAGTVPDANSSNPAKLHHNADKYKVKAQHIGAGGGMMRAYGSVQTEVGLGATPPEQSVALLLNLGWKYDFRVQASNDEEKSPIITMPVGKYMDLGVNEETYASPFIVVIPEIDMTGAAVTATADDAGFKITIIGMDDATDFEIVYTTDNTGADFTNANHQRIVTNDRVVNVSALGIREYNIKVRPLRGGWVASTSGVPYVETSIVGGAGGALPNEKLLPYVTVDIYGEAVTGMDLIYVDAPGFAVVDYAYSGLQFPMRLQGKNILDSDSPNRNKYKMIEIRTQDDRAILYQLSTTWDIADIDVSATVYLGNVAPNVSGITELAAMDEYLKRQKFIYQHNFSQDVIITRIDFDCDITDGTDQEPAILRFYQYSNESLGKEVEVTASDYFFADQIINLSILSSRGARRLVVDTWDPAGIGNFKHVSGILTIHYRDIYYPPSS
jgi:hypothetical protein